MPITVTPTLSSMSGYIDDVRDQVATLVRYTIMSPGWTSSLWNKDLISFRRMSSEFEGSRSELAGRLGNAIQRALQRMFHDYSTTCDFSTGDYTDDDDGRYTVKFNIFMSKLTNDGQEESEPALISGNILVDPRHHDISLKYDQVVNKAIS